jgi:putative Mn2+ efflux pump MntP
MVYESISKKGDEICTDLRQPKILLAAAFATSIDAVAAGVSLAIIQLSALKIITTISMIAVATSVATITGIKGGRKIGLGVGKKAELTGGVILILLGVKILMEHLNILY